MRDEQVTSQSAGWSAPAGSGGPGGVWADVPLSDWDNWRWQQSMRLRSADAVGRAVGLGADERAAFDACNAHFRVAVTPYYASLMRPGDARCPIRLQALPQPGELLRYPFELDDPLGEDAHTPVPGITYRYPDRVLFYVTHNCPVYCRHCTRKRKVSDPNTATSLDQLEEALAWIERTPTVRDVLVSGGDPLTLSDERLAWLLDRLSRINHVDLIRIGTRNPVTLPQRVTDDLCHVLRQTRSLMINTHFNHPAECTERSAEALDRLARAGASLGNQMVLLRGVNDDPEQVLALNRFLLRFRCRPYYMFQADMAAGITHFRTPLRRGVEIIDYLRGRLSGPGIPHFAVDLPGGGGKITLTPDYLISRDGDRYLFRNGLGQPYEFVDVDDDSALHPGAPGGAGSTGRLPFEEERAPASAPGSMTGDSGRLRR